ncbi:MAG: extracellular solute-binding protein [Chloroflexi bacterium]|nr:extracellular solute-binding protein [Chloroflexota bacterium]MCC6896500.1 extracellular solute-binding protein [Anaerolineae bacterium]
MRYLRLLLVSLALLLVTATAVAQDAPKEIFVYTDSDTNISDWWTNTLIPAFEAEHPEYKVVLTIVRGVGGGNDDIANRALAALETGDDPQVDYFETMNVDEAQEWVDKELFLEITEENVPNIANVIEATNRLPGEIPYRGSQVLLAYNSEFVAEDEVPTTYEELMQWIQDHPGQFVYNRPDKGGSGAAMVTRAIFEVTGKDPSLFVPGEADAALIDQFPKAWELLSSVHEDMYEQGAYPAGNTPVLELFANGSVNMITAWSDQALQAMNKGLLPEGAKLAQLQDLPFTGGYSYSAIPSNSTNQEGALALANFVLSPAIQESIVNEIGGFPAVAWSELPEELQTQFTDVITDTVPTWPGGDYGAAMVEGWYNNVATNIDPAS